MKTLFISHLLILFLSLGLSGQIVEKDYQFLMSVNTEIDRKMYANEVMIDENQQYLIVNYGNKPTYIVVFDYGLWQPIVHFRLPNWVEFSGTYIDYDTNNLYVKESRYSSEYYKLDMDAGTTELHECESLPGGCPVVEPKQAEKSIFSSDKTYYITINKKNARDVRVYVKR